MRKLTMQELGRLDAGAYKKVEKLPAVIVLDNVRSLSNVGSIFRTADAFRVAEIYLCGITGTPPHREIHKTALGATESVKWSYWKHTSEAISHLKNKGYSIAAVEQTDESIFLDQFKLEQPTALVFGNEVEGVDNQIIKQCDFGIEIPQAGTKHSLNISVCTGIVLWHLFHQFKT